MAEATAAESISQSTAGRKALVIVFLVVFIDLLGFGIVLPLLPLFGESYIAQLFTDESQAWKRGAMLGLLMATFSAMQFLFAPIWGRISDRVGRRPILLLGLVGSVLFYALFGYASDLPSPSHAALALTLLFIARIGAGIAGATISTAQAVIADSTTPEKRKLGMALIGAAFGIGFTFGPLIGAGALWLYRKSPWYGLTGYTAAALSFIALLLAVFLLPETRRFGQESAAKKSWFDANALRIALANPAVAPIVLSFFLATFGFANLEVTQALLNQDALGVGKENNFLIFAYIGFILIIAQGFLYRRLAHRFSEISFITLGIGLMGCGVLSLGGVSWAGTLGTGRGVLLAWMFLSLTAAVIGFAFFNPSAQALISRRSDPERQGEILGVNQSAAAMARILGPIFGLTLYSLTPTHVLPYLLGALLLLGMLPLIPIIRRGGSE